MNNNKTKNHTYLISVFITTLLLGACQKHKNPQTIQEQTNQKKAIYCMDVLENQHDLEIARRVCFAEIYIQHTPWIADRRDAVLNIFANRFEKYPDFAMKIKRTGADKDLVWMHLHTKKTADVLGNAGINIFRMKDGKFVEHWNVGQPVPEKSSNENTMF